MLRFCTNIPSGSDVSATPTPAHRVKAKRNASASTSRLTVPANAAILAHRSQRGGVVMDASFAFVLPEELIARGDDAYETFFAIAPGAYAAA